MIQHQSKVEDNVNIWLPNGSQNMPFNLIPSLKRYWTRLYSITGCHLVPLCTTYLFGLK